jgi:hypothetical protein
LTGLPVSKKADRFRLHPKHVGVHDAAGQEERVELLRPGLVERDVNREPVSPVRELPTADVLIPGRDDARLGTGLVERLARLDHLDLLEPLLDQDCDL